MIKNQSGLSFIEVLIAFVILATGVVGAVAMQTVAKKGSFDAMQRSIASSLAQDILERMRSNQTDVLFLAAYTGTYGDGSVPKPPNRCDSIASPCGPLEIVANDLYEWEQKLIGTDITNDGSNLGGLTDAEGCISGLNNKIFVVVSWQGRTEVSDNYDRDLNVSKNCGTSGKKRRQVIIETVII